MHTQEVQALLLLRGSCNIVRVRHVYEDQDYVHIFMDFCNGQELFGHIASNGVSEQQLAMYFKGIAQAARCCHLKGR